MCLRDRSRRGGAAFGLADAGEQALAQHHVHELVHARRGRRAGGADDFLADRVDRADIIDDAALELDGQFFALREHVGDALVRGVAAGEHLAVEQEAVALFPARDDVGGEGVEVDADRRLVGLPVDLRIVDEHRRFEEGRAAAVERHMRVARRGAVRDHRDGLRRGVRRPVVDFHVEHGREAAEPLRADAERIDLFIKLDAQLLGRIARPACEQLGHVDRVHQRLLREQHRLFGGAADADAEHARRAPAGAHLRDHFEHPVDDAVASGSSS